MPFDLELASASMGPWFNDMWTLRDRYPELAFLFDELEELRENAEEVEEMHAAHVRDLEGDIERLKEWRDEARQMLNSVDDSIFVALDDDEEVERTVDQYRAELECTREELRGVMGMLQ